MKTKLIRILFLVAGLSAMGACSSFLDVNENPNNPSTAEIDLLFPNAIVEAGFWTMRTGNENASIFSRQFYSLNESTYNIQGNLTDTEFNQLYADPLKDFAQVIKQSNDLGLKGYAGISKIMSTYLFSTIVDLWGDVPYSEALQGETILSAKFDTGASIYDGMLKTLDEAQTDLGQSEVNKEVVNGDLIYGGDLDKWRRAANTLKLKLLLNLRLVDENRARTEITKLLNDASAELIADNADDFQFEFGPSISPANQHPIFQQEYVAGNKVFYMSNYFMYSMLSKEDPRILYYVYRQGTNAELDFQTEPCAQRTDCPFWPLLKALPDDVKDGYIGRDHGDPSGQPADNTLRATFGVYPIGGSYDNDARNERTVTSATGAGLAPWITNAMRCFMQAEAALVLGTPGDAKALLTEGIQASMDKVTAFGAAQDENAPSPANVDLKAKVATYIGNIEDAYDDATTDAQRLDVIIKEKYFAQFGNGVEPYNDYRRTGFPSDLPASLAPNGPFPVRFPLGPTELTSNPNAPNPAPLVSVPVFWDVN